MFSNPIIVYFDIFKYTAFCLLVISIDFLVDSFSFNSFEKGFISGIIITIPFPAHALLNTMMLQQFSKL